MDRAERGDGIYVRLARFGRERQPYIASILAEIEARGGLGAGELDGAGRAEGGWWGWSERSEEHTSELQSLMRISYAVFCLKKKKQTNKQKHKRTNTTRSTNDHTTTKQPSNSTK